jgi:hypothetical protein
MRWIKSGQPRDTRHGKLNKETKKMGGIKIQDTENTTKKLKRWA